MTWKWPLTGLKGAVAVGALGLVAGGAMGCAEEREPISRVQANALSKKFFVGNDLADQSDNPDFYANGTLTDVGYGASQSALFTAWYSSNLSIIRWEVTEDALFGRLAYERIENSDGKGAGTETADGQVLYAFKIDAHFDIRRGYNPTTGEELNVIEENTSDRPWYEREYMRVDWSKNLTTEAYDYDNMALLGILDGVEYESINYYINDPSHPDAPHFDPEEGYFDITTKAFAKPQKIHIGWWGQDIPACFLDPDLFGGTAPAANCNPVEIAIRNSFWKKPDRDYEAADWDGYEFQSFGPFLVERYGYARNYGMTDNLWHRFISRYNIWKQSHYYTNFETREGAVECYTPTTTQPVGADPTRDVDPANGTHDECEVIGNGSRCDPFAQKCTLPFAQREVAPILFYYTKGSDQRYFEGTQWATQEWDIAIRVAAQAARYAECNRVGGENCTALYGVPQADMYVMRDLVDISTEADDCRLAHRKGDTSCNVETIIDTALLARGYDPATQAYASARAILVQEEAVILCHGPVEASDHPLCGAGKARLPADITAAQCDVAWGEGGDQRIREQCDLAFGARIGDVRYHLVNVIKTPQTPSPWGFGPTFADPLTGEAISASINVWSTPTDLIAQQTVDTARYIGGELSTDDVTDGIYVKDWALANEVATGAGAIPPMNRATVRSHVHQARNAIARDFETGHLAEDVAQRVTTPSIEEVPPQVLELMEKSRELANVRADANAMTTSAQRYRARRNAAQGTETEAELTTVMMQQYAGTTDLPVEVAADLASPLRALNPSSQRELRLLKELKLAERGACMLDAAAPSPTAMVGLTDRLQRKFGAFNAGDDLGTQLDRAAKMHDYLAQRMHYAVIIHEMGHTFGYRHNFVSSSSAINYRPQYWQLRTRDGKVSAPCNELVEDGANCVDRRYYDPVTAEEQDQLIHMFMHSSVMDYAGDITQDLLGLGSYDWAAARMFYGRTATVFTDDSLLAGQPLSAALVETVMDNFGGIIGYSYQSALSQFPDTSNNIHYSQLQSTYNLIQNCKAVDPSAFKPANWDEARWGVWDETMDGHIVQVDGQYTRCQQQPVDYVHWEQLRKATDAEGFTSPFNRSGPAIDHLGRTRVPYAFATDRWADIGNTSVYRHDSGADPYELFNFFVTEQEVRHIFDNYRRNRQTFNVRGAANRVLGRYNSKMRDSAKGLALQANFFRDLGANEGLGAASYFDAVSDFNGWEGNLLAAGLAFDHFSRQMARPQPGSHGIRQYGFASGAPERDGVLRFEAGDEIVKVPDGAVGYYRNVGIGGKLMENQLADDKGEFDAEFTMNAGAYYDKINSAMLFTESVDNFISDSLEDFTDPRYRSVSLADMFPDGYRRWLANNLTEDAWMQAPRMVAAAAGNPVLGPDKFPAYPMGWTSWWTDTPEVCFPNDGTTACTSYGMEGTPLNPQAPGNTVAVDPQISWEQHKFLIAWTLVYLPENQKQTWLDMMGIWQVGSDSDPGFPNRIELHLPSGDIYVARTFGSEEICFEATPQVPSGCKTVQRGIGARILEYANELMAKAYITTPVTVNGTTWYEPIYNATTGQPLVRFDPKMDYLNGFVYGPGPNACDPATPGVPCCGVDPDPLDADFTNIEGCTCDDNRFCQQLSDYSSVPKFMRTAMRDFRMADVSMKGIYD